MSNEAFIQVYRLYLESGGLELNVMNYFFNSLGGNGHDGLYNASWLSQYFNDQNELDILGLKGLYIYIQNKIKERSYEDSYIFLQALEFMQTFLAEAIWRFHKKLDYMLDDFVRNFDRLDVESERVRLYTYIINLSL